MCGFVAAIGKDHKEIVSEGTLRSMTRMLTHRGPDDEGLWNERELAFGFRRLSIIDLSPQGHQPMLSAEGRYVIVFNGEIYNYLELRAELEDKGVRFSSHTDTEVLLAAYQLWGEKCLSKLSGMFAFVVADRWERNVFAARDPLGIKPLYHWEDGKAHIFCSEPKALLPYAELEPDYAALDEYLCFRGLSGPGTLFKNLKSVQPGSCLTWRNGILSKKRYFELENSFSEAFGGSFAEACETVESALQESVKLHLRSDVELGIQLSGGVDSSLVTALAAKQSGKAFHTFSISVPGGAEDESAYQKMVSQQYGSIHHDYPVDDALLMELLPQAAWGFGAPLNDPNSIAAWHLSREAKKHVTVMLSGEGADESFLGYRRHAPEMLSEKCRSAKLRRIPGVKWLAGRWPFQVGRSWRRALALDPVLFAQSLGNLDLSLLLQREKGNPAKGFRAEMRNVAGDDLTKGIILQDQAAYLAPWLQRADTMGMAHALEFRVPLCTKGIFQLANSLPYRLKVYNGERKAILKKIAEKYLPMELIYRKKVGFSVPGKDWIEGRGPFRNFVGEMLSASAAKKRPFAETAHFREVRRRFDAGEAERHAGFFWTYANLELWQQIFFEGGWKRFSEGSSK
ncbi:MAG: asparagine synthase (glutamine-hydrolyzing) [Lentisphaerae bacterium GWF2_52_8]|nr:MAG: asparagine synthase (glutamine-hydrolyzing) [Lentisphaerae bacterium GWF2_52_8]